MKNSKKLTLSIVIPVYNEEDYLGDCLDSIATQSELPDEVIVVDNNCTDASMQIAQKYPFVKIITEKKQHQAFAQRTGFNYASGDILGRIDADSVLPKNWVEEVKKIFAAETDIQAITGAPKPYDIYAKRAGVAIFMFYHNLASKIAGTQMLWGANSAIRKNAWAKIQKRVLQRADIWEDYDIALLIGGKRSVKFVEGIDIGTSFRTVHKPLVKQVEWQFRIVRTFYYRKPLAKTVLLAACWSTMIFLYPLVLLDEYIFKPMSDFEEHRREILESAAPID